MKLFHYAKDGGKDSTVWGFWLIEWKRFFSVALLCFENGSREAFHNHAFNSWSIVLSGDFEEEVRNRKGHLYTAHYGPGNMVYTSRDLLHKVRSQGRSWVLTFRGPWQDRWIEYRPLEKRWVTLTHGRQEMINQKDRTLPARWADV